jgi:hypothetical protein
MSNRVAELAYAEAVRAVNEQASALAEVRARAGTLFSTGGISSAFLAGAALQGHEGVPWWGLLALALGFAAIGCALNVLWPRRWTFVNDPRQLANDRWAAQGEDEALRLAARYIAENLDGNDSQLAGLWKSVEAGMLLMAASILAWFVALALG